MVPPRAGKDINSGRVGVPLGRGRRGEDDMEGDQEHFTGLWPYAIECGVFGRWEWGGVRQDKWVGR